MLVENQKIEVNITCRNMSYFKNKGYNVKFGDTILVNPEDLSPGAKAMVWVTCDNPECVNYNIPRYIRWPDFYKNHDPELGDFCQLCGYKKAQMNNLKTYGVKVPTQLPEVQKKIEKTNLKKYGVKSVIMRDGIREMAQDALIEKYGGKSAFCSEDIRLKAQRTLNNNGETQLSSQQKQIYEMLSEKYECEINVPCSKFFLDIAVHIKDVKIDIEYDGWYWHKDSKKIDNIRNHIVNNNGYKILRIRSRNKIPDLTTIENALDELINTNKNIKIITLDDWQGYTS